MADERLTDQTPVTTPEDNFWMHVVDPSVTVENPAGDSFKMTREDFIGNYYKTQIISNVSTPQVIDWALGPTWYYVQLADITFTESNTPPSGFGKTITVYILGAFTPTLPVGWTVKSGVYSPVELNQYVVEWVTAGVVWVNIHQ